MNDKLTLNVGLRYDLIDGYQFDQSKNPNFVKMQDAGRAGQLTGIKGLENFGQDPEGRHQQLAAAPRASPTTCAATART